MNNIDKLIEQGAELVRKHEEIRSDILNDPELSQEFKDEYRKLIEQLDAGNTEEQKVFKQHQEENKGKKIIGYNAETFWPIYEN
jgi:hypothetical protein